MSEDRAGIAQRVDDGVRHARRGEVSGAPPGGHHEIAHCGVDDHKVGDRQDSEGDECHRDIGLPDIEGFEVARVLAVDGPPPLVILTSSRDARAYGRRLANGHFLGFIP